MAQTQWDIIIVGGGIAGFSAAKSALDNAPDRRILLISQEDRVPYKRTKISKFIAEGFEKNQFQLEPPDWYDTHHVKLLINSQVIAVDPKARTVTLDNGEQYSWQKLILATGSIPIVPTIVGDLQEAYVIRTAKQVEALVQGMHEVQSVIVVGMGVLGVEVAEQLRRLQKQITMVGNSSIIMPHQLNRTTAQLMRKLCEEQGIELLFNERVVAVKRQADHAYEVSLRSGSRIADLALFCIGITPNLELAQQAGLQVNRGILVNRCLQTSQAEIYAAGDVAEHPGGLITHLWHAAEYQGILAGKNVTGASIPYEQPPFRVKCEVFAHYFFSINTPPEVEMPHYTLVERQAGTIYQGFYYEGDVLRSVVMVNDKDRAKQYEKAVREGWTRKAVEDYFTL